MQTFVVNWHGQKVTRKVKAGTARGIHRAVEEMLTRSNRVVPIETHDLENSGVPSSDPVKLRGAVSYDRPYAVEQHENMQLHHDAGRKAKYLEDTANEGQSDWLAIIADEERKEFHD